MDLFLVRASSKHTDGGKKKDGVRPPRYGIPPTDRRRVRYFFVPHLSELLDHSLLLLRIHSRRWFHARRRLWKHCTSLCHGSRESHLHARWVELGGEVTGKVVVEEADVEDWEKSTDKSSAKKAWVLRTGGAGRMSGEVSEPVRSYMQERGMWDESRLPRITQARCALICSHHRLQLNDKHKRVGGAA